MKVIYFAFKHRFRYKDLNNFLSTRFYGKYLVLNLGGPFKHFIAKFFLKFRLGFAISCDGRPLISDKKLGINFFVRGTNLNIPIRFKNFSNNYVSINNPFDKEKNLFQVYPININKSLVKKKLKIIYVSGINIETTEKENYLWKRNREQILENFTILDDKRFWKKCLNENDFQNKYIYYRKLKLLLRFEIINYIKKNFNDKFELIGDDWKKYFNNSISSNFNPKYIKDLYQGNICLDLGSIEGSSSLYSRSNQIIEAGGLIVQSKQSDHFKIWGQLEKKVLFKNLNELKKLMNTMLNDNLYSNQLLDEIYNNFSFSTKLMEKNLDMITKTGN